MARKCPKYTTPYFIKADDVLSNIARKYNTTVNAILRVNSGLDPDNLRIGQKICIPLLRH